MGKLNWSALLLVALGGLLLVVAWEGTHRKLWAAVTGQPQSSATQGYSPSNQTTTTVVGASGDFGPPPNPTGQQINQRVCRDNPNAPACKPLGVQGGSGNF